MNHHKIVSTGRLKGVHVNIDGVRSVADFEVIEILGYSQPYIEQMGLVSSKQFVLYTGS
jgi:hypothetical protein